MNIEDDRLENIDSLILTTTQLVAQSVKSDRQVNCQKNETQTYSYSTIETPLSVGVGLWLYHTTRSKKMINFLADLNVSINYDKVSNLKKDVACSIQESRTGSNGTFIPTAFSKYKPIFFAIDNTDLKVDTPDGKNQLHGTAIATYQQKNINVNEVNKSKLIICLSVGYM